EMHELSEQRESLEMEWLEASELLE
ncbi:MAG: hypothetical protein JWR42_1691, partial [Marmoricola sp.]|nr:hypothetical protein [Marmoricola sp.]MCW2818904.1 hypothetical protein [Marmoricola sp.]